MVYNITWTWEALFSYKHWYVKLHEMFPRKKISSVHLSYCFLNHDHSILKDSEEGSDGDNTVSFLAELEKKLKIRGEKEIN